MPFRAPKCPVCHRAQKASSALQHSKGNYACGCTSVDYAKAVAKRKENPLTEQDCSPILDQETLTFVVYGEPVVKKNGMRVVAFGGHSSIRPSKLYEVWASRALYQLQKQWAQHVAKQDSRIKPLCGPVWLQVKFYRSTKRAVDLSNLYEGVQDCLTASGIWLDDTIIQSHDGSRKLYDKANPRIEVTIRAFKE